MISELVVEEEVMVQKGMFYSILLIQLKKKTFLNDKHIFILTFSGGRFGGAGFGSRDYRTTSSMPPSRGSSGPPRRDYGGGSNNGNSFNPYVSGALSAKNIILFYVSLVMNLHKYVSLNFQFLYRRWILWWW